MKTLICIMVLVLGAFAKDAPPNPADFRLSVRVISYTQHLEKGESVTQCRDTSIPGPYDKTARCDTFDEETIYRETQLQIGDTDYKASCVRYRCIPLAPGNYVGRWKDKNLLEVLSPDSHGALKAQTYRILSAAQIAENSSAQPCSAQATVEISSTPKGADILIDGTFVGNTPSALELSIGNHAVVIEKNGFKPWERNTHVVGGNIAISADLDKVN